MLNINHNHNQLLLQSCKPLADYSLFVHNVRKYMKGRDKSELDKALTAAISNLPDESVIKPILLSYRSEVFDMCLTEYTQEHADRVRKIEAKRRERAAEKRGEERGEKRGEERGELKTLSKLVNDGILTLEQAAERAGMTVEEFKAKTEKLIKK